eukprot:6395026-Prymnesium_polylepis.1
MSAPVRDAAGAALCREGDPVIKSAGFGRAHWAYRACALSTSGVRAEHIGGGRWSSGVSGPPTRSSAVDVSKPTSRVES